MKNICIKYLYILNYLNLIENIYKENYKTIGESKQARKGTNCLHLLVLWYDM